MTTQVIIKSPSPNHLDLLVEEVQDGRAIAGSTRVREGEEVTLNVYGSRTLRISEIQREEVLPPPAGEAAEQTA